MKIMGLKKSRFKNNLNKNNYNPNKFKRLFRDNKVNKDAFKEKKGLLLMGNSF
jgi:hypothetical protein